MDVDMSVNMQAFCKIICSIAIWICNGTGVHLEKLSSEGERLWELGGGITSLAPTPHIAFANSKGGKVLARGDKCPLPP